MEESANTSLACLACHGAQGEEIELGPIRARDICSVCGGTGRAHPLTVAGLVEQLTSLMDKGVSPHTNVRVQVYQGNGRTDLTPTLVVDSDIDGAMVGLEVTLE